MAEIEIFFDYACPYCLTAHNYLLELLPEFSGVSVIWRPCESHPRPDRYGYHSDLCIQGMFYAAENGFDLLRYHERMYELILKCRINVEDINILSENVSDFFDCTDFSNALKSGKYAQNGREANNYAFGKSGVWVVPAYRCNGFKLDAVENIGVTKPQLKAFLINATMK